MKIEKTNLKDCYILTPNIFGDARGSFCVPFNRSEMEPLGFATLEQCNQSSSQKGVLRGLHYQAIPDTQTKIVFVNKGAVIDVVVDMRQDSETYGQYTEVELTADNHKMLFVPRGFAHGFLALQDDTRFEYYVDNIYSPKKEGGILWNDPDLKIPWKDICSKYGIDFDSINLKAADQIHPLLKDCKNHFYIKYRYLVTGATGQLGYDIVRELNARGIYDILALGSNDMDITDEKRVQDIILSYKPEVIFHCAAYTNVKGAETNQEQAEQVNKFGTKYIVENAARIGAKVVYVSTDYVFDGTKDMPYFVTDLTNPVNVYGKTKLMGEQIVSQYDKSFIVRTSWVFGIHGNNFVKTMIEQAKTKQDVNVVKDQIGSPTYTVDLAKLLVDMAATEQYGIYQAHNEGFCSWYDFTKCIYQTAGIETKINPILSTDFPSAVTRPQNSCMSTISLAQHGFDTLPPYQDAVKRYLKELKVTNKS